MAPHRPRHRPPPRHWAGILSFTLPLALLLLAQAGCTSLLVQSAVAPAVDNLQYQSDLELVCDGAPAYLLMLDSLLVKEPGNQALLMAATQGYSAYAAVMEECGRPERSTALAEKARGYGAALLAGLGADLAISAPGESFARALAALDRNAAPQLFWGGYGLAIWVKYQAGSPAALALLPRLEQMMQRVVVLDPALFHGAAHTFLGTYYGARPLIVGGDPAKSKQHFEQALALGNRDFLLTQVAYAETYARQTFDRELYEKLLREVLAYPMAKRPGLTLSNTLAQRKARRLLDQVERIF
ncbi:MAG TPA: TRAP transporter TatT component family protein [Desulfurivibrionaceae bacterium]|nr:TRAP transporter TatT component family protein [Desulfurivibrionaceae bacterium]